MISGFLLMNPAAKADDIQFYVSPFGDDGANGSRSDPFKSLFAARDAVRAVAPAMQGDITVYLDPGNYYLEDTLVLGPEDSTRSGGSIIYRSSGGPGKARVIGAKAVDSWSQYDGDIWVAEVASSYRFHSLYENGRRAWKARMPNRIDESRFPVASAPYFLTDVGAGFKVKDSDLALMTIADWDFSGAEIVISPRGNKDWELLTLPVVGFDPLERLLMVKQISRSDPGFEQAPIVTDLDSGLEVEVNSRYFIQGVFELLDQPGEFHHDYANGLLYFWPREGDPNASEVLVPQMQTVLAIMGDPGGQRVRDIRFEGIRFEAADFTDYYAGPFSYQGYRTGMVTISDARNIHFRHCHFLNAGFPALMIVDDNAGHIVEGSLFENAGGGIWATTTPQRNNSANRDHLFINNLFIRMGEFTHSPGVGIKLQQSANSEIAHCHVRDVARWGFSIRGRASNRDDNIGARGGNIVRHSVVERAVQDSGDAGALHTANISVNVEPYNENFFRQIIVRDTRSHPSIVDPWSGNGLFTDFESFGQVFEDILIVGTEGADPYRANPVQGPNPTGLTPNHTFNNVSWEEDFDEQRMEYDQIGLLPDFPRVFLRDIGQSGFFEDFNSYTAGPLVGQGSWQVVNETGPSIIVVEDSGNYRQMAGPAPQGSSGTIAAYRILNDGLPLSAKLPIQLEFDILQLALGNIPSVGIGGAQRVPASIGIIQGRLIVRGEGFGTEFQAYHADGEPFQVQTGVEYRLRSQWWPFANAGAGKISLAVKEQGQSSYEKLYFIDQAGELHPDVQLEIQSNPSNWDRVWLRVGSGGQMTLIDNIRIQVAPPSQPVNFYEHWQSQWFSENELVVASIAGQGASPGGDGVPNLIKAALGVGPFDFVSPSFMPRLIQGDPKPRLEYTLSREASGLTIVAESSVDLLTWYPITETHSLLKIQDHGGRNRYTFENPNSGIQSRFYRLSIKMED